MNPLLYHAGRHVGYSLTAEEARDLVRIGGKQVIVGMYVEAL
jgi:hypothetical protein